MINIDNHGPRISNGDIDLFEVELGVTLPEAYRKFLLSTNGGLPSPDIIDIDGLEDSPVDIQVFFGIGRNIETSDLYWNLKLIRSKFFYSQILPIACDSGGCFFCLNLYQEIFDVIYFDMRDFSKKSYNVSPNFSAFLDKIRFWTGS